MSRVNSARTVIDIDPDLKKRTKTSRSIADRFDDGLSALFPDGFELIPQLNELYELRLALLEARNLSPREVLERGAYFRSVHGNLTYHFLLCSGAPLQITTAGDRRRNFFQTNQFKTGYATHGLFPYRGKFHPQMVKAILNVIGIKPGETVLDPMMGSGTTIVEACTIGVNAIGLDISPFCALMARTKVEALTVEIATLEEILRKPSLLAKTYRGLKKNLRRQLRSAVVNPPRRIVALAFLDAIGFSARSSRMNHERAFAEILGRYVAAIRKFQDVAARLKITLGDAECRVADARSTGLPDASVDGVLFSPPYSFAVDYITNDIPQLELLGIDVKALRRNMIGLRGRKGVEQVQNYVEDVERILVESFRVLRPGKYCVVIVGSNSRQLAKLRQRAALRDLEDSLEELFIRRASDVGLVLTGEIRRQVTGIANSLREESILIFQKPTTSEVIRSNAGDNRG
ncbi:MAG: hypothetical protein GXP38_10065 [Chloroflexi bacterium]|nr:hypothetical protein [Chloroflexota bacterium]